MTSKLVTDLKIQNKNKNRTSVYLDGEYSFGLTNTLASSLAIGQELSEKQISENNDQDEFEEAFRRADHFIGYRPRAVAEVTRKLHSLHFNDRIVEKVVERLSEQSILDDKRFASQWVEERSNSKPRGRKLLENELHQKGVQSEIIQQALGSINSNGLALKAAHEYARKLQKIEWVAFRQKLSGFLMRRGFEYSEILPIVKNVWEEKNIDEK